jgi:hypothetical protein
MSVGGRIIGGGEVAGADVLALADGDEMPASILVLARDPKARGIRVLERAIAEVEFRRPGIDQFEARLELVLGQIGRRRPLAGKDQHECDRHQENSWGFLHIRFDRLGLDLSRYCLFQQS